jgi:hypothetical protein
MSRIFRVNGTNKNLRPKELIGRSIKDVIKELDPAGVEKIPDHFKGFGGRVAYANFDPENGVTNDATYVRVPDDDPQSIAGDAIVEFYAGPNNRDILRVWADPNDRIYKVLDMYSGTFVRHSKLYED